MVPLRNQSHRLSKLSTEEAVQRRACLRGHRRPAIPPPVLCASVPRSDKRRSNRDHALANPGSHGGPGTDIGGLFERWSLDGPIRRRTVGCRVGGRSRPRPHRAPRRAPRAAPVNVDWWHIAINDPGKTDFQAIADAYMADHPEREDQHHRRSRTRPSRPSSRPPCRRGDIPDLFQSWGGGTMRAQADAGLLQDITADVAPWKNRSTRARSASTSTTASSTACRGTWASSASGTTRTCSRRPGSPPRRRHGTSSSPTSTS